MKITFSFDDNNKLNFKLADLFDQFDFKATFFLMPTIMFEYDEDIKALHKRGFEIGSHTFTHPVLTEIKGNSWLKKEIKGSKEYLEKLLNTQIFGFCYPKGQWNARVLNCVYHAGYKYARTVGEGLTYGVFDKYTIKPTIQIYNRSLRRYLRIKRGNETKEPFSITGDWFRSCLSFIKRYMYNETMIIHIWGHSWEIDYQNQWNKLEKLLEFLQKSNLVPVTNYEAYFEDKKNDI